MRKTLNNLSVLLEELKYPDSDVIILTDRRDIFALRDFLKTEQRKFIGKVRRVWRKQEGMIKKPDIDAILETRSLPQRTMDTWAEQIREFVTEDIIPAYQEAIGISGDKMARRINRRGKQAFEFDPASTNALLWMNEHGGELIVQLTTAQYGTIHALLSNQVFMGITSPYQLGQMLKPLVGLTAREAIAALRMQTSLIEAGLSADLVASKTAKYRALLHRRRAARIARTELSHAYGFGQQQSVIQALDAGFIEGTVEKNWIAGGADPCDICLDNEAAGPIPLEATFPSGDEHNPAHPHCECSVGYQVRR